MQRKKEEEMTSACVRNWRPVEDVSTNRIKARMLQNHPAKWKLRFLPRECQDLVRLIHETLGESNVSWGYRYPRRGDKSQTSFSVSSNATHFVLHKRVVYVRLKLDTTFNNVHHFQFQLQYSPYSILFTFFFVHFVYASCAFPLVLIRLTK